MHLATAMQLKDKPDVPEAARTRRTRVVYAGLAMTVSSFGLSMLIMLVDALW